MEQSELDVRLEGGLALVEAEGRRLGELALLVGSTQGAGIVRALELLAERDAERARLERVLTRAERLADGHAPGRRLEAIAGQLERRLRARVPGVPSGASLDGALAHWRRCCECRVDPGPKLVLLEGHRRRWGGRARLLGVGAAVALGLFAAKASLLLGAGWAALVLATGLFGWMAARRRVSSWRLLPEALHVGVGAGWFPIPIELLSAEGGLEARSDALWIGGAWRLSLPTADPDGLRQALLALERRRRLRAERKQDLGRGHVAERLADGAGATAPVRWIDAVLVARARRGEARWDVLGELDVVRFLPVGEQTSWVSTSPGGLVLLFRSELPKAVQVVLGLPSRPAAVSAAGALSVLDPEDVAALPPPTGSIPRSIPWPAEFRRIAGGLRMDLPAGRALEVRGDEELLAAVEAARLQALIGSASDR